MGDSDKKSSMQKTRKKLINCELQNYAESQSSVRGVTMGKLEQVVIEALKNSDKPLMLAEIAEKIGQSEKKVFRELRSLFDKGIIDTENRRYRLMKG
jgi:predicted transcriptional regulator